MARLFLSRTWSRFMEYSSHVNPSTGENSSEINKRVSW